MKEMNQNTNAFDQVFQSKLAQHAVPPPPNMLSGIQAGMAQKKNNRKAFWLIITDASIMLLFLLFSGFAMFSGADDHLPGETTTLETVAPKITTISEQDGEPKGQVAILLDEERNSETDSNSELVPTILETGEANDKEPVGFEDVELARTSTASRSTEGSKISIEDHGQSSISITGEMVPQTEPAKETESSYLNPESNESSQVNFLFNGSQAFGGKERTMLSKLVDPPFSMENFEPSFNDSLLEVQDVEEKPSDHEVFAGLQLNLHTPLIFNQNTHNVFGGKELAYKPTFGVASSVRLGYTYKRHYGVELSYVFYSKQGQHYSETLNGMSAQRQVNLNYMHIPILLRYKFKEKAAKKISSPWVVNLGMQIGILQSASITHTGNEYPLTEIPNAEANDKDYFKPSDLSVVFGVEKEIYLNRFLLMGLGLRTTYSGDINADDWPVLKDAGSHDKSHNFTFAFTVSLNYYRRFK